VLVGSWFDFLSGNNAGRENHYCIRIKTHHTDFTEKNSTGRRSFFQMEARLLFSAFEGFGDGIEFSRHIGGDVISFSRYVLACIASCHRPFILIVVS
jgi:hypothetical protein